MSQAPKRKHPKKKQAPIGAGKDPEYKFNGEKGSRVRKGAFITELATSLYNVKHACKQVGVDRRTYFRWKQEDEEFNRACFEIDEGIKDEAEIMLQNKMTQKDTRAIIFYLKTKAKDRGYTEKKELLHEGSIATTPLIPGKIIIQMPNEEEKEKGVVLEAIPVPHPDKKEEDQVREQEVPDKVESNVAPRNPAKPGWSGRRD